MIPNDYKTSLRISSQLPEFIRDDVNYETFVAFVEAYYEWLELANTANANTTIATTSGQGVTYASKNLQNYSDVDSSLDGFLQYYINDFLPYFPENALADKAKVLKIAKELYQSKGTPASYKLLFRLLYNSDAQLLMTGDLVFRASAGEWYVPKFLKIKGDAALWLTPGVKNYRVFGQSSKSFATIENVILNGSKCDVYISNIERLFESGEDVTVVDAHNQDIYVKDNLIVPKGTVGSSTVTGKIVGAISQILIDSKYRGLTYQVGDPVVVYGGLTSNTANSATAYVAEVTRGSIQRINTEDGGFGYIPGQAVINFATVSNTTIEFIPDNGGAAAHVATFDTTPGANSTINKLILDRISVKQNITLNAASYFFSANGSANANCTLQNAFSFLADTQGYPISSVAVDNGGGGFTQLPTAIATSHYYDVDTGAIHDLNEFGILAPIEIIDGGVGYKVGDRITIDGGHGYGASANVNSVDINGTITSIKYVPYEDFTTVYPLGGMGYDLSDIDGTGLAPQLTANPSSNIAVTSITQGKFPLWDIVYQTYDTYANAFFGGIVNGIDVANNALKVYNIQGTLNNTQPLISHANTQNTVTATSNTIAGVGAELFVPGILGTGANFSIVTDRIGSITKIAISNPGEDYISNPQISLKVQDLCVTGVTQIASIIPGSMVFQGQDVDNPNDTMDVDVAPYQAYVDRLTLLQDNGTIESSIYNLRVYNYYGTPRLLNLSDTANTIIQLDNEQAPYPTMNLTTVKDSTLGYTNGVKKYGDGTAKAKSKFLNGLIFGNGQFLNTKGQPSSYSILQSQDYNDFTYVLSVEQPISKYRDILKNLLHPAGTKVIGRDLLQNQKAFGVSWYSVLANSFPLSHYSATANVSLIGDFANTSNNIVTFKGITPTQLAEIKAGQRFGAYRADNNGPIVYSKITSVDSANLKITLYTSPWLTYPNVAYGYANVSTNVINITANTEVYGKWFNNNEWSSNTAAENPIVDIIYPGDKLLMNGIVYTVNTVSYGATAGETKVYLANTVGTNVGSFTNPKLISINRNIIDSSNVTIYTIQ